jgi:hypothetical protein
LDNTGTPIPQLLNIGHLVPAFPTQVLTGVTGGTREAGVKMTDRTAALVASALAKVVPKRANMSSLLSGAR